jgi:hypothetical protein
MPAGSDPTPLAETNVMIEPIRLDKLYEECLKECHAPLARQLGAARPSKAVRVRGGMEVMAQFSDWALWAVLGGCMMRIGFDLVGERFREWLFPSAPSLKKLDAAVQALMQRLEQAAPEAKANGAVPERAEIQRLLAEIRELLPQAVGPPPAPLDAGWAAEAEKNAAVLAQAYLLRLGICAQAAAEEGERIAKVMVRHLHKAAGQEPSSDVASVPPKG